MKELRLGRRSFQPRYLIWAILVHAISVLTLTINFKLPLFGFAFAMAALTAYSLGIFHHMYLSHLSFEASPWFTRLGVLLGTLTWRGPMAAPLRYAALHRIHHRYSDKEFDPHSPHHGLFHSLLGWNWWHSEVFQDRASYLKLLPKELVKDHFFMFFNNNVNLLQAVYGLLLFGIGFIFEGWELGLELVCYGVFVKTLIVVYGANLVDVINHTIGYRNYSTPDRSTNSFLMGALHLGGAVSWHNNHHAKSKFFTVKRNWWEFDVHYLVLRLFQYLGIVKSIKVLKDL